jgi:hypothetical protein
MATKQRKPKETVTFLKMDKILSNKYQEADNTHHRK